MKKDHTAPEHLSNRLVELCTSSQSVSSLLAENPNLPPGEAWDRLFGSWKDPKPANHDARKENGSGQPEGESEDELRKAAKCGNWGPTQPSELFLKIYYDALCTLEDDPSQGMVSPSLMGSCGVVPLTVISVIPDIARHMANAIVRAEKEVYLATNYWQDSVASKFITDAIRELNRRAGQRGAKIVMKIIYDRGSPKQLLEPHYIVSEKEYTGKNVNVPHPSEIPNIDLQVMNFHTPLMGTFHSKYMVVDRKIGLLQSNNIQDNDNLEMMIHLEGPIVDSLYDVALLSWHKQLDPPLPSHNTPAAQGGLGSWPGGKVLNGEALSGKATSGSAVTANGQLPSHSGNGHVREPGVVDSSEQLKSSNRNRADVVTGPSTTQSALHPLPGQEYSSGNKQPTNHPDLRSNLPNGAPDAAVEGYLAKGTQALPQPRIQDPNPLSDPLPQHNPETPHYDADTAGEVARAQAAVSPRRGETRVQAVARLLNHSTNPGFEGDRALPPDACPPGDEMTPYIAHATQKPVPMALVNRSPYGPPTHRSVATPQNAAWLSALRNAQRSVFIQTPTLNAEPLIPAIRAACERGVDVVCYVCLGYNDAGELLPRQGGHNEMVAHDLYQSLSATARQHLHYFWYVGKDQKRPLVQAMRKRSCHIKLMIVDEHVAIQGNGNQDTQSWFHSQEINVMLDSAEICRAWIDGLRRNQNTHVYGALSKDSGVWVDGEGKEAEGVIGVDPGKFSWAKGFVGAIKRVQGQGGF
ncbi:hypothetical protein B0T25DRAFT_606549 [Lasiosphaeria hispida]|uniref:PLD phosphodiesterase domain-containing protein n=1 Tax=Lasiosphaeria hispida TaxID=260671 RepID=A0AAJ0MDN5_9PEZI|nr:hypothetical protein B0T25DRAFT_606549 [Lasiosphaeria hispida]